MGMGETSGRKINTLIIPGFYPLNNVLHRAGTSAILTTSIEAQSTPSRLLKLETLFDGGCLHDGGLSGGEPHLLELVIVLARTHAAPVGGTGRRGIGEVDDKLHVPLDDVGRVSLRTHRDVAHRRIGADGSRPRYGDDVILLLRSAARNHYGGEGVYHRAWFPVDFHDRMLIDNGQRTTDK